MSPRRVNEVHIEKMGITPQQMARTGLAGGTGPPAYEVSIQVDGDLPDALGSKMKPGSRYDEDGVAKAVETLMNEGGASFPIPDERLQFNQAHIEESSFSSPQPLSSQPRKSRQLIPQHYITATYSVLDEAEVSSDEDHESERLPNCSRCGDPVGYEHDDWIEGGDGEMYCGIDCMNEAIHQ